MAKLDKSEKVVPMNGFDNQLTRKKRGITRRDFFKITAAAGAGGGVASMLDWAMVGPTAAAYTVAATGISTCPYCAVGCNMIVARNAASAVVDIYGDDYCPINNGGLCSKGAAALQLVNNTQRVGVPGSVYSVSDPVSGTADPVSGGPMYRLGNGPWQAITWDQAMSEIAARMVAWRQAVPTGLSASAPSGYTVTGHAHGVAFLGCANATNEENWLYRKLATNFGTNDIEHQARI